jgi:hypothetical protein
MEERERECRSQDIVAHDKDGWSHTKRWMVVSRRKKRSEEEEKIEMSCAEQEAITHSDTVALDNGSYLQWLGIQCNGCSDGAGRRARDWRDMGRGW